MSSESTSSAAPVLALIRDLMFAPRVTSAGSQLGIPVKIIRDPAALAGQSAQRLVVDLALPGAIDAAAAWKAAAAQGERTIIGFAGHTDTETISHARAAGFDRVLTRGQFVQMLGEVLGA